MSSGPLLFLAPMAGVTNTVFRSLCKNLGADVLTTEFVSAEGILHRNERTRRYLEFQPLERPLGIQLFGADPSRLAEAVKAVIEWVSPDFIDLNFGCPVNKVVSRNGGSALLKDCPLLASVAREVVGRREVCRSPPKSASGGIPAQSMLSRRRAFSKARGFPDSRFMDAQKSKATRVKPIGASSEQLPIR